jgi:hypothetical protein
MSDDVEASQYDIGVSSVRLIRVGNVIQILFSKAPAAKQLYADLARKYKRFQDELRGD